MIEGLRPYPEYKESGQVWLGRVPSHWTVLPNRAIFAEVKDRNHPDEEMLSVTITRGIVRQKALLSETSKKDNSNLNRSAYKRVQIGDIAYNKMRAWQGALGASSLRGIISPAYVVMRPREKANPWFYHHLYRTSAFAKEAERWSYGITSDMWSLRPEHFKVICSTLPSPEEQEAIVRFLNNANRRIDQFINAKRKLIELLREQKKAIIHRTVTAGFLDILPLNVLRLPMEVREYPEWNSYSVGHLIQRGWIEVQDGNHGELHPTSNDYVDTGIPFLMANNVRPEGLDLVRCAKLPETVARGLRIGFAKSNDVLLTHKATIGQVCVVPKDLPFPFVMLTPQVTYYRIKTPALQSAYLFLYMQSSQFQEQLRVLSLNQSTRNYIGLLEQRNLVVCFPDIARQEAIIEEVARASRPVDEALRRTESELALFNEYRTRLTADIVTGQLDVREAATNLLDAQGAVEMSPTEDVLEDEILEESGTEECHE